MKAFRISLTTIAVIITAIAVFFVIYQGYQLNKDIDSLIDRAQVSADREDMLQYMEQLKGNMEKYSMTHGHTALIFKTPMNDMALHYKAINRIIERLHSIKSLPKNETAYQVALDDIRGTIRELPDPGDAWLWITFGWWLLLIGLVTWIPLGIWWTISEYS